MWPHVPGSQAKLHTGTASRAKELAPLANGTLRSIHRVTCCIFMQRRFPLSRARAVIVALLFVLAGVIVLFVVAPHVRQSSRPTVFELGAVILSIGLISSAYEFYLRRAFTEELLDAVGLAHELKRVGIQQICTDAELDWTNLLENGTAYGLLLLEPTAWVAQEWPRVMAASRRRQTQIRIYLPDPGGDGMPALAARLALQPEALSQRIADAEQEFENAWKNARDSKRQPVKGSSLEIRYFPGVPAFSMTVIDDAIVFLVGPAVEREPADPILVFRFERQEATSIHEWASGQLSRLDAIAPVYAG